ncbi:hypothetical protein B7463_g2075, partial [Scytalidium lignicola]
MEHQDYSLDKWQSRSQDGIKGDGEDNNGNSEKSTVLVVLDVAFDIQSYQALDNSANHEADTSEENLLSYGA